MTQFFDPDLSIFHTSILDFYFGIKNILSRLVWQSDRRGSPLVVNNCSFFCRKINWNYLLTPDPPLTVSLWLSNDIEIHHWTWSIFMEFWSSFPRNEISWLCWVQMITKGDGIKLCYDKPSVSNLWFFSHQRAIIFEWNLAREMKLELGVFRVFIREIIIQNLWDFLKMKHWVLLTCIYFSEAAHSFFAFMINVISMKSEMTSIPILYIF